jgi:BolA protein
MSSRADRIRQTLTEAFQPEVLEVRDDSAKHAGHAAMKGIEGGESHYHIHIQAAAFEGKSRIQRHRMVQELLKHEFDGGMHALSIQAEATAKN